jgi:hypothetical protein
VLVAISFTARVPVTNSHSYYELGLSYAKRPGCTIGGVGGPTNADIRAGQRVHMQDFHPLSCPGPIHGTVRYVQATGLAAPTLPGSPRSTSVLVGRFTVNPTPSNKHSP